MTKRENQKCPFCGGVVNDSEINGFLTHEENDCWLSGYIVTPEFWNKRFVESENV